MSVHPSDPNTNTEISTEKRFDQLKSKIPGNAVGRAC